MRLLFSAHAWNASKCTLAVWDGCSWCTANVQPQTAQLKHNPGSGYLQLVSTVPQKKRRGIIPWMKTGYSLQAASISVHFIWTPPFI